MKRSFPSMAVVLSSTTTTLSMVATAVVAFPTEKDRNQPQQHSSSMTTGSSSTSSTAWNGHEDHTVSTNGEETSSSRVVVPISLQQQNSHPVSSGEHRAGRILLNSCQSCHVGHPIAPQFWRNRDCLLGISAGTMYQDYPYSSALRNSGIIWEEDTLDLFLEDPQKYIPGTHMESPPGMTDPIERKLIIQTLKSYCLDELEESQPTEDDFVFMASEATDVPTHNATEEGDRGIPEKSFPHSARRNVLHPSSTIPWMTTTALLSIWFLFGTGGRR